MTWRSYAGVERTRDIPAGRQAWNPVSPDGWARFTCGDASVIQIAMESTLRSSMGPFSIRTDGRDGLIAPLGTLWGEGPWHDGQANEGTGLSDLVTPLVGARCGWVCWS